ncbi:MAG TPA: ABC transporter permease, partial [Blastocatellia bacterium]
MNTAVEGILNDIRYAARALRKSPAFASVAILTLALGIGANTTIFSVVYSVLLKPLPYSHPDRLVWVSGTNHDKGINEEGLAPADFIDLKSGNHSFEEMSIVSGFMPTVLGLGEPERIMGGHVSANFFSVLGAKPALGRTFLPDDDQAGKRDVTVLAYSLWKTRLGGNPQALGKT